MAAELARGMAFDSRYDGQNLEIQAGDGSLRVYGV
jgi:hypothetical protein